MKIQIHAEEDGVKTLGPGLRYVVWTQGCLRGCPGCMTPEGQAMDGGYAATTEDLAKRILHSERQGLTISGGEPFLQAPALADVLSRVKQERDIGVILYTGYTLEELQKSDLPGAKELLSSLDLLIDGPFVQERADGKNLRGSSNQRAIPLTSRYQREAQYYGAGPAEVEFFLTEGSVRMVGVPSPQLLKRLKDWT